MSQCNEPTNITMITTCVGLHFRFYVKPCVVLCAEVKTTWGTQSTETEACGQTDVSIPALCCQGLPQYGASVSVSVASLSRTGMNTAYACARPLPNCKFVNRLNNLFYNGEFYRQQSTDKRTDGHPGRGERNLQGTFLVAHKVYTIFHSNSKLIL
jgi:hypothetical protein